MGILGSLGILGGENKSAPIVLVFKSASTSTSTLGKATSVLSSVSSVANAIDSLLETGTQVKLFDSYSFERNLLAPGAPFRFTAPGIDKKTRLSIRSGDTVQLLAIDPSGDQIPVATGFVDETDTHISANRVEYVITGRDTLGQLIDNSSVDANNQIVNQAKYTMDQIFKTLIANTRMPQQYTLQQMDNGTLQFSTNIGETKMNALQRYMQLTNSLVWTMPNGQARLGKPNVIPTPGITGLPIFSVGTSGSDIPLLPTSNLPGSQSSNVLDCRVRRNVMNAIRQIVVQMQNGDSFNPGKYTIYNNDSDVKALSESQVGKSIYMPFTFGSGASAVNFFLKVSNVPSPANQLGAALGYREIARENVQVLDVEITVQGHFDNNGDLYDVDNMYFCNIPDEDISDALYCYSVNMELTLDHGMITKLRLCKPGTIVAGSYQFPSLSLPIRKPTI